MNARSKASSRPSNSPIERLKAAGRLHTITALVLVASATGLSGCASGGDNSTYRTHEMGPPKGSYRMSNQTMPNYPGR